MLIHRIAFVALVLFPSATAAGLQGQDSEPESSADPSDVRVFGSFGVGWGSSDGAGMMSLSVRTRAGDFIARTAGTFDVAIFARSEDVADLAVMYGRLHEGSGGWVRLAAGPSWVESRRDGDVEECVFFFCTYEQQRSTGFGLAIQADAALRPRRTLGIGVSGFANVGTHSFGGVTLTLHIGRVSWQPGSS